MAKYYISNENSWQTQKNKQEKIGQGIDVLYDIDRCLDRAFSQLEYDKYGLMTRNSYSSRRTKIQQCDKKNSILYNYSKSIHGIVADKDFQFFKELNKAYEELSLLDIKEYTTKNTLNITEKKTIPISYYSGSMAYQSGKATSYETRDVLKGNINIYDIQMKCDMFRIEEQLKAYLDTSGEKLSDKEIKEAKENFYKGILNTSFEHEVYADDFFKGLSTTLDYIPVVGGVKNVIEGCTGYTMTGEKLRDSERATYAVLGTLSTTLDLVMFGTASGLIQGGKYVGKEVAKASIKQATKVAIQQTTGSVVMGWTSQFASEKLRDMGLSSEEIFAIHILAGITTVGVSKYKDYKNLNNGATDNHFKGMLKGKEVELPNVSIKKVTYTKRDTLECTQLRNEFNAKVRSEFLKDFASKNTDKLKDFGLTDTDIAKLNDGLVPKGYQVHHKLPLDDGGTNDFNNLILIKNDPYHKVITNYQNIITKGLDIGESIRVDWPIPNGNFYNGK